MKFDASKYYKERYHSDPEFRKRVIECVKKYQKTEKGKKLLLKEREKRVKSGYYKDYCKARKEHARLEGLCTRCYTRKVKDNKSYCEHCKIYYKGYNGVKRQDKHRD